METDDYLITAQLYLMNCIHPLIHSKISIKTKFETQFNENAKQLIYSVLYVLNVEYLLKVLVAKFDDQRCCLKVGIIVFFDKS